MNIEKGSPLEPIKSSYTWSRENESEDSPFKELDFTYKRALKAWVISALLWFTFFFLYHFWLVPSVKTIELLVAGDFNTYNTHIILKSIILVFGILSSINSNLIVVFYFWAKKSTFNKKQKRIKIIDIFKNYMYFYYITIFLLIPARNVISFIGEVKDKINAIKK